MSILSFNHLGVPVAMKNILAILAVCVSMTSYADVRPLTDEQLGSVTGGTVRLDILDVTDVIAPEGVDSKDFEDILEDVDVLSDILNFDLQVSDVVYPEGFTPSVSLSDAKFQVNFPSSVGQISLKNISVSGASAPLGSIQISNMVFSPDTQMTVTFR